MKKLKILALIATTLFITQCTDDTAGDIEEIQQEVSSDILQKLSDMGYNIKDYPVTKVEGGFVVEGDMVIPNENINHNESNKQRRHSSIINCANAKDIKIKNELPSGNAHDAFNAAVNKWNFINGSIVRLHIVNRNQDITIKKNTNSLGTAVYAHADLPKNGKPGKKIRVVTDYTYWTMTLKPGANPNLGSSYIRKKHYLSKKQFITVLTHEIGHTLGFEHTDELAFGEHITGTQIRDANSIMDSSLELDQLEAVNGRLSSNDKKALRKMYPSSGKGICGFM